MAITALPEATVRLLGSAQALTTPASLVKELIDNALDAKATAIDILISQNTLDKIEVRDNGHGIPQQDLDALGRRGHTSKLRSFDELKAIGGISLGFRGEALASAVQLGEVSVTSRTDADTVATSVKLKASGGIESQTRKSHPVGTTVCVLKFLERIPVRKQTTLKAAPKTLVKVKELLQAYALSRPSIRFSFKITKGAKGSWSFAPRPSDSVREAVSQVIGRDAAAQCTEKSLKFPEVQSDKNLVEGDEVSDNQFLVEAFLPRQDAEPSKIGHGQFISIDSRPVSHEKGTLRRIVTIFKHCLKAAFGNDSEIKNPFLRLSITCPVESYDANVEPAKDDVIFENEYLVLEALEALFRSIYGESKPVASTKLPQSSNPKLDTFELLLARKPPLPSSGEGTVQEGSVDTPPASTSLPSPIASDPIIAPTESLVPDDENEPVEGRRKWGVDMSRDFTEDTEEVGTFNRRTKYRAADSSQRSSSAQTNTPNTLNPWLIAKLTAPVQRGGDNVIPTPSDSHNSVLGPSSSRPPVPCQPSQLLLSESDAPAVPSFAAPPRRRYSNEITRDHVLPLINTSPDDHHDPPRRRYSNETLQYGRSPLVPDLDDAFVAGEQVPQVRRQGDFVSARNLPENVFVSPPATIGRPRRTRKLNSVNKPFAPPRMTLGDATSSDGYRQRTLDVFQANNNNQSSRPQAEAEANMELEWAMDYEQRKEDATRRHRQERQKARESALAKESEEAVRSSPHQNRYNSAIKALEADQPSTRNGTRVVEPFRTTIPDGDPRAYWMKQQKLMGASNGGPLKLSRAKSMKLPLERIPADHGTHDLQLEIPVSIDFFRTTMVEAVKDDVYINRGNHAAGLVINPEDATALISTIKAVVEKWMVIEEERRCEAEYNFESLLRRR